LLIEDQLPKWTIIAGDTKFKGWFDYQQGGGIGGEDKLILTWITVIFGFSERKAFDRHSSGGRAKSRIR
jgi:hypothetical protein